MEYDIIVIGGGPAGYVSAIRASKLGAKVALVERDSLGGTCLNRGCIPTKDFLKNVEIIKNIKKAKKRGIIIADDGIDIDIKKIVAHKDKTVKILTGGVKLLLKSNNVDIYEAMGEIVSTGELKEVKLLDCKNSDLESILASKIIIATGSSVRMLAIAGVESEFVYTSDSILDIDRIPRSLVIIGGGVIGCEFAQFFANIGTEVTIVEAMDRIIPMADEEISSTLEKVFKKDKIKIITSANVKEISEQVDKIRVHLGDGNYIEAERALLSVGRKSNLSVVGSSMIEVKDDKIVVDEYMQTSIPDIYAIGDVNGLKMLAHAAFKMGEIAAENAMGASIKCDLRYVPSVVYTFPEVAFIGACQRKIEDSSKVNIGKFNYISSGRAQASDEKDGFIKVISEKNYNEILGVHMIGGSVSEIVNEVAVIMQNELTIKEVLDTMHAHPSYSEILYEAMADALNLAIHK